MKKFDKALKEIIQSVEKEIPEKLESGFRRELEKIIPEKQIKKPTFFTIYRIAAAAALLLLVILYLLFPLFNKMDNLHIPGEILIQSVNLEGRPAETYIIREKNPDLTIIWIDKKREGTI